MAATNHAAVVDISVEPNVEVENETLAKVSLDIRSLVLGLLHLLVLFLE